MYTVTHNDTPATIAAKFTGSRERFHELVAANPHKPRHGHTFADLTVGEHLRLPTSWHLDDLGRGGGGGHGGGHGGGGHGGGHGHAGHASPSHVAPTHAFHGGQAPSNQAPGGQSGQQGGQQPPSGGQPPSGHQSSSHAGGHGHPGHHPPPHHGHPHGPPIGRRLGWGGWGWGSGWWNGDWFPYYYDVTEAQVDACSWMSLGSTMNMPWRTRDLQQTQAKAKELVGKLKPGEVQFFRFSDASGIFQFYSSQDGRGVMVDRCDDGIVGVGQNYLWDRYPGEIDPQKPAHTLSVGLAGEPQGVGACGCAAVTVGPESGVHHNCCQYPDSACSCDILGWNYAADAHQGSCPYRDPNYGSEQIHLLAGVGPLGPSCDTTGTMLGTPQAPSVGPGVQNFVQGVGQDATILNPIPGVIDQPVDQPILPPLPPPAPSPVATTTAPTAVATTTVAPPTAPNTAMVVGGLVAVGLGLAGIAYLAHSRMSTQ